MSDPSPRHIPAPVPPGAILSVKITASEAEALWRLRLLSVRDRDLLFELVALVARPSVTAAIQERGGAR